MAESSSQEPSGDERVSESMLSLYSGLFDSVNDCMKQNEGIRINPITRVSSFLVMTQWDNDKIRTRVAAAVHELDAVQLGEVLQASEQQKNDSEAALRNSIKYAKMEVHIDDEGAEVNDLAGPRHSLLVATLIHEQLIDIHGQKTDAYRAQGDAFNEGLPTNRLTDYFRERTMGFVDDGSDEALLRDAETRMVDIAGIIEWYRELSEPGETDGDGPQQGDMMTFVKTDPDSKEGKSEITKEEVGEGEFVERQDDDEVAPSGFRHAWVMIDILASIAERTGGKISIVSLMELREHDDIAPMLELIHEDERDECFGGLFMRIAEEALKSNKRFSGVSEEEIDVELLPHVSELMRKHGLQ